MSKMSGWDKIKHLSSTDPRRINSRQYAIKYLKEHGGRKRTPEERRLHSRKQQLRKNFNITPEDYATFLEIQGGVCAICQRPERARKSKGPEPKCLSVDHNHRTAYVRGLLCQDCNVGLGSFNDDILRLQAAIQYLQRHF